MHSINSFLQFYRVGNIERWRYSSSLIIIASRRSKYMHIISIKIIMCSSKIQAINIILNKGKLLRYSVVWRIQKDNRITLMGCLLPLHMMIFIDIICMFLLLLLAIIMREELYLHLSMFPTR